MASPVGLGQSAYDALFMSSLAWVFHVCHADLLD